MSKPLRLQSGTGVWLEDDNGNAMYARGTSVPVDGTPGYAKGCMFIDLDASAGSILWCNEGTSDSCDFDAVTVA